MADDTPPSRFAAWRTGLRDRMARSSRVFLLGLIVACGIEVLVDWNSTLFEINVLRDRMRERGYNYVGILTRSTIESLRARDGKALDALAAGLFDDEDVALVRFTTPEGAIVHERVAPAFDAAFKERRGKDLRAYYEDQLRRDVSGIVTDPNGLRQRMAGSRYRDVAQRWNDFVDGVVEKVTGPKPHPTRAVLYQDRLRTDARTHDDALTYALGAVREPNEAPVGAIVVAFTMDRTNAAIRTKYLKGLGMVVFFVSLILVQNIVSRRDKLRLLDLETRYGAAKQALRDAFPKALEAHGMRVAAAIDQAQGAVDGMAWDARVDEQGAELWLVDPDGDGIDAAAVGLQALRAIRAGKEQRTLLEAITAVGAATHAIPLTRPVGVIVLRVDRDGVVDGIASASLGGGRVLTGGESRALEREPIGSTPEGIVGPLERVHGVLPAGAMLVSVVGHAAREAGSVDVDAVAEFAVRAHLDREQLADAVHDAVTWARGNSPALVGSDLAVAAIARA